jgi:hypothetical protein
MAATSLVLFLINNMNCFNVNTFPVINKCPYTKYSPSQSCRHATALERLFPIHNKPLFLERAGPEPPKFPSRLAKGSRRAIFHVNSTSLD